MGAHERAGRNYSGGGGGGGGDRDDLHYLNPYLWAVEVIDIAHVVDSQNFETSQI